MSNTSLKTVLTMSNCHCKLYVLPSASQYLVVDPPRLDPLYSGLIVGPYAFSNSQYCSFTISDCYNTIAIDGSELDNYSGGIVGPYLFDNALYCTGSITNCTNYLALTGFNCGGIVGPFAQFGESSNTTCFDNTLTLTSCINNGATPSDNGSGSMVGAFSNNYYANYSGLLNTININSCTSNGTSITSASTGQPLGQQCGNNIFYNVSS